MARPRSSPGDIAGTLFALALVAAFVAAPSESAASPVATPVIDIVMASRTTVFGTQSTEIFCVAHQDDGAPLTYYWTSAHGTLIPSGDSALWFAPENPGVYSILVEVDDDAGGFAVDVVSITVEQNEPPVVRSLTAQPAELLPEESAVLSCDAYDIEGQLIDYEWIAPSGEIIGSGPSVTWRAPDRPGDHRVALRVSDELGSASIADVIIHVQCPEPPVIEQLLVWPTLPDYTKTDGQGGYRLLRGQLTTCEIECVASPSDANLSYQWSCTAGSIDGTGNIVLFTPPHDTTKVYVTATISDVCGHTSAGELLFRVFLGDTYPTDIPSAPGCLRCMRGY